MKCKDCACYKNEWCSMVTDSPDPDMDRDCGHFVQVQRWIPVTERLPEKDTDVLVYATTKFIGGSKIAIDKLEEGELYPIWLYTHGWFKVTHWMPLPEFPGGGDADDL